MANFSGKYASRKRWTSNKTITVNNSMTADEINEAIKTYGAYVPNNYKLFIKFDSGTYNITSPIKFNEFYGDGIVIISPSSSYATSFSSTQPVFIDASSNMSQAIEITSNFIRFINIEGFKIKCNSAYGYSCVYSLSNLYAAVYYSWLLGNDATAGYGFSGSAGYYFSYYNNLENMHYGLFTSVGVLAAQNNQSVNTYPAYGAFATNAGTLALVGTTPTGSTANTIVTNGGKIR